jgi:hypothetical protein
MCYQVRNDFSDVDVRKIKEFSITNFAGLFNEWKRGKET